MATVTHTELEQRAMEIPPAERLRLAARLLASVVGPERPPMSEQEALDLAEKRAAELDCGEAERLDYHTEMVRIRASLKR